MWGRIRLGRDATLPALAMAASLLGGCTASPEAARVPKGYPGEYVDVIRKGIGERRLLIWSNTDNRQVVELLADFRRRYPEIAVDYFDIPASELNRRFLAASKRGGHVPDLLWSSAMDLQIKLVNDGHAQGYASPERAALAEWANWKDEAWGVTAEPIVMIYNRRLVTPAEVPDSHVALRALLEQQAPNGPRVATYDPSRSAVGYLYLSQDEEATRDVWRLVRAMGANRARLFTTTETIIDDVAAGRSAIGYNIVSSYALQMARAVPDLRVVMPSDYTLVMSRIAMIPARAAHPNAARLFLDHLLSRAGQAELVAHAMPSSRRDLPVPSALRTAGGSLRAIRVGPALLVEQDGMTRARFLRRWSRAMTGDGAIDATAFEPAKAQ